MCLSTVCAKYSSSGYFGTEHYFIILLRNYALALLNKAIELYKNIVDGKYLKNDKNDWQNKFTGANDEFSCTVVLSDNMTEEIKTIYS